jgi:hypothetical protein
MLGFVVVILCLGACSTPHSAALEGPPQQVEVHFANGSVRGGVSRVPVALGRVVALVVISDVADEVHVHGFDLKKAVPAGGTSRLEFVADRPGIFEAELESRGTALVQLEVR